MSWSQIEFAYPYILLFIPVLVWMGWMHIFRRKSKQTEHVLPHIEGIVFSKTWRTRLFPFLPVLVWLALILMVLVLARPRIPLKEDVIKSEGIDIMLAVDISSSMLARDFSPNRMEACKIIAADFVNKRPADRIGLVIFAGEAYTLCPLTTDRNIVTDLLKQINVGILEDQTAIGMGLATAVKRLKDIQSKSKIIILLTDGDNNAGYIDPLTATELAKTYGIKVYTIAVGTNGIAKKPGSLFGNMMMPGEVSVDTELLDRIAAETNGKFYHATDNESLQNIYDEINRLEKSEIDMLVYKRFEDKYRPFLIWSVALLLLHTVLLQTVFKNIV